MSTDRIKHALARVRNGCAYLARGDLRGFMARSLHFLRDRASFASSVASPEVLPGTLLKWGVMATPHTLFIAHLIARRLREHGWNVTITTQEDPIPVAHYYVVVCPQMFRRLPPGQRRFAYQMEQSVSSRWFTRSYLNTLRSSRATLDYALVNFEFLEKRKVAYPHTYYLPVGADPDYGADLGEEEKRYDVLFYGDAASSPRRQKMLATLKQHFSVHHCSEVFGDEMRREIMRARVVINLHYYENALLEMPRIQECLSLGVPVVSESSQDQNDYPEIFPAVSFFPQGDEQAMVQAVGRALSNPIGREQVRAAAAVGWERFCFMFDRFLVGAQMLHPSRLTGDTLPLPADATRVVLSLPETITRRRSYESARLPGSVTFDGLRYTPGWIGCGLSYSALARHGLRHGIERLAIIEDDALLSPQFENQLAVVRAYLDRLGDGWDIFAGLIADLHVDAKVLRVETFQGMRFVTVDRMTSMVCNIYSRRAQELIAAWDPAEGDADSNTIDRYLESRAELRVVVALPFLAGLRQEQNSTLWGIDNRRYIEMVAETEAKLQRMADAFEAAQHRVAG